MACGVGISGCAIGSAIVLASIVAGVIDPANPGMAGLRRWLGPLSILLVLWGLRASIQWLQARLAQRGASAVIADLSGQVLTAVTARRPSQLAAQRDAAAVLITRGLDGLRPYFTGYLPTLLLAAILTPATVAVIGLYDLKSMAIVVITLPLIPIFMVLIGLATTNPLGGRAGGHDRRPGPVVRPDCRHPHPAGAGPCFRPGTTHRGTVC